MLRRFILAAAVSGCSGAADPDPDPGAADSGVASVSVDRERSLVWTDPAIVEDPSVVGLGRVMAAVAEDGQGGVYLRDWFEAFATSAHSERLGPALLIEELEESLGPDPSQWDLDALPFLVTGVHNRIDLGPRGGGCGELRVSLASTHPIYAPFHIIFLFRQVAADGEDAPRCLETARRWAHLSELDHEAFLAEARALLDETLTSERFLLAESVELTVSPWEWRQWRRLDNPPLFQTVDTPRLNQPGPLRDDFLAFARQNAEALGARVLEIPERFRARAAQVPPGVPRETLDLELEGFPGLAQKLEVVGCPACHTDDAEFVHTTPQRTFSDFYDRELDARAAYLEALAAGEEVPVPPYGPLQELQ